MDDDEPASRPGDAFWRAVGGPAWEQWQAATGADHAHDVEAVAW